MKCPLCDMEKITEWKFVICKCSVHKDKWMLVLGEHIEKVAPKEEEKFRKILCLLFPDKQWRTQHSIKDHFHLHEV